MQLDKNRGVTLEDNLGLPEGFMTELDGKIDDSIHYGIGVAYKIDIIDYVLKNFSYNELVIIASKYIDDAAVYYIDNEY